MTEEQMEHLKEVEPGRTVVPMYFIRRPLGWPGDSAIHSCKYTRERENDAEDKTPLLAGGIPPETEHRLTATE